MISGWVAGTVRARALARRRLGAVAVRGLAASPTLTEALETLTGTPYGHDVQPGQTLAQAQHATSETLVWNLRVLAGWLPLAGVNALRAVASWFETLNVQAHLAELDGAPAVPPYRLGALATAWPRLAATTSPSAVRAVLASSPWGDPGTEQPAGIALALRTIAGRRVVSALPEAAGWVTGAAALQLARERLVVGRPPAGPAASDLRALLGTAALDATTWAELVDALPRDGRRALERVDDPDQLWRAELGWWQVVEGDAFRLLRRAGAGRPVVCGAVALLAVDAWRVAAALELAARGGRPMRVFDDVA